MKKWSSKALREIEEITSKMSSEEWDEVIRAAFPKTKKDSVKSPKK